MSYLYGLDPNEANRELDTANTHGLDPASIKPGFWDNTGGSVVDNLKIGGLKLLQLGTTLSSPEEEYARSTMPQDQVDEWDRQKVQARQQMGQQIQRLTPNPLVTGTGAKLAGGFAQVLPTAIVGGALAGPAGAAALVGGSQGVSEYTQAKEDGLDEATALGKGAIAGVANAAGVAVPMAKIGAGLLTNLGIGAAVNTAMGMGQRGATAALLEHNGYTEMAKQYQWLDKEAIVTDALLGAAFGGAGHVMAGHATPDRVDTALQLNEKLHVENEAQPGIHRTPESRDAGVEAFRAAMDDVLVKDKTPDVTELAPKMDIEPNPAARDFYEQLHKEIAPEFPKDEAPFQPRLPERVAEETAPLEKTPEQVKADADFAAMKPHDNTPEGMARAGDVQPVEQGVVRQIMDAHPDLQMPTGELHPDGSAVTTSFSQMLAQADKGIEDAKQTGALHDVAVACFLRG